MASSRKSRRRSRKSPWSKFILGIIVLSGFIGLGYAFLPDLFSGNDQDALKAEELMGLGQIKELARKTEKNTGKNSSNSSLQASVDPSLQALPQEARKIVLSLDQLKGEERSKALVKSYQYIAAILERSLPVQIRQEILKSFHSLTDELFFSNIYNDFNESYLVKNGDTISKIANKKGVTEELICRWNNISWKKRSLIHVGDNFKIVVGKPRLLVDKSDFCLSFYFGENLARQYIIAHGKGNNTPEGKTTVMNKEVDPDQGFNKGAMQQEMDERWIGLNTIEGRTGIGIHGTKYENSIPGETSHGCVRMYNKDVVELYDWVPERTEVLIRP